MSALMIFFVAYASEYPLAVLALVGLLACVSPEVHHEIALLGEGAAAIRVNALEEFQARVNSLKMKI